MFFRKKKWSRYSICLVSVYISKDWWRLVRLRGNWQIFDNNGKLVHTLKNATKFQAKRALRWWNKYGCDI